jgi:hypothetical protein
VVFFIFPAALLYAKLSPRDPKINWLPRFCWGKKHPRFFFCFVDERPQGNHILNKCNILPLDAPSSVLVVYIELLCRLGGKVVGGCK